MDNNYMLIVNPISGTGRAGNLEEKIRNRIEKDGSRLEIRLSEYAGHCRELAEEAVRRGFYAVLAAGGDGTVNEVASALTGTSVTLGIIPRGSGNGLARHIDESIDIDNAIRTIEEGNVVSVDYGTANGRPFFCTFGLGFDAEVSHDFSTMKRRGLGTYIKAALRTYLHYKPKKYQISLHGRTIEIEAFLIAVCNASQYGNNAYIAPWASIRDGVLDIVVIHYGNPLTRALVGVDMFTGYLKRNVLVEVIRTNRATIRQTPAAGHLDGDPAEMPETIEIECHPQRLKVFAPMSKTRFKPVITPLRSLRTDMRFRIRSMINRLLSKHSE